MFLIFILHIQCLTCGPFQVVIAGRESARQGSAIPTYLHEIQGPSDDIIGTAAGAIKFLSFAQQLILGILHLL